MTAGAAAGTGSSTGVGEAASGRGILFMILATLCLASMDAVSKILVADHAVAQLLWVRHAFLVICCLLWFGPARMARAITASKRPLVQSIRVTVLIVEMGLFMLAVRFLPLADTHAILAASPLIVTALAWPLLGEPVGLRRWLAVCAGFLGVLLIIRPGFGVFEPAALIPLLGASLWGLYQVLTRLTARDDSGEIAFIYLVVWGFGLTSLALPWVWQMPTLAEWPLFLAISILGALGHICLLAALRAAPASSLQPFSYCLILWAVVFGVLLFGDVPDIWVISGALIVVASGLYTWHRERRRQQI